MPRADWLGDVPGRSAMHRAAKLYMKKKKTPTVLVTALMRLCMLWQLDDWDSQQALEIAYNY